MTDASSPAAQTIRQEISSALAEFRQLTRLGQLTPSIAARLSRAAASAVLRGDAVGQGYLGEAMALLVEMATIDDPSVSQHGVHGIFPGLVEHLADTFDPAAVQLYNQLFVQVIQACRQLPGGAALDAQLRSFGLITEGHLLQRAARIRVKKTFDPTLAGAVKKALVLSRVTLGADVAVTSLALAALRQACPKAEVILFASPKTQPLFAGDDGIHLCPIAYPRGGGLLTRLAGWVAVVEAIQQHIQDLDVTEYIIVDPDSRLTQLGLLPLGPDDRPYYFFDSRSYSIPGLHKIGALTAHWLQSVFGLRTPLYPFVALAPADVRFAQGLVQQLRRRQGKIMVSTNLGVGTNPAKRLPDPFESLLLEALLREGVIVLLDKGGDEEEAARVDTLRQLMATKGFHTAALDEAATRFRGEFPVAEAQLVTWQGSIGTFGALVAETDVYIGYDSAGQHLAAALGVPTIDIFAGFTSPRMPERWSPHGPAPASVHIVEDNTRADRAQQEAMVSAVVSEVRQVGQHDREPCATT
jgi:ADP-heptose:LPS heptosyltransferase